MFRISIQTFHMPELMEFDSCLVAVSTCTIRVGRISIRGCCRTLLPIKLNLFMFLHLHSKQQHEWAPNSCLYGYFVAQFIQHIIYMSTSLFFIFFVAFHPCIRRRCLQCVPISGLGFRRGSYKCVCRKGFYFPDTNMLLKYYNGSTLEEEYEKYMLVSFVRSASSKL